MAQGVAMERYEGTPQGGPLSPLLANVLLDEVDKELEKRGHTFVRYADDCNVYVRSRRAGERVLGLLRQLYAGLRLRINETKSAVDLAWKRKILGYSFWVAKDSTVKRRVADKALATMKDSIRDITKRTGGRSIEQVCKRLGEYLRGWKEYYRLADTPRISRRYADPKFRLRVCTVMHTLSLCPISGIRPRPGRIGPNTASASPMRSLCSKIRVLSPSTTHIPMKTVMSPSGSTFLVGYWLSLGPGAMRRFG